MEVFGKIEKVIFVLRFGRNKALVDGAKHLQAEKKSKLKQGDEKSCDIFEFNSD